MEQEKKVRISADCICDLPQKYLTDMGIDLMYYYIRIGENSFQDTFEIDAVNVLEHMEGDTDAVAMSEPPSVTEYREFFEQHAAEGPRIHICAAAHMSGGYGRAAEAAVGMKDLVVLDSGQVSGGHGLVVLMAARMAEEGCSLQEIADRLERDKKRVRSSFIVSTMTYLLRNRMIEKGLHFPKFLNAPLQFIHPFLQLRDSTVKIGSVYFGSMEKCSKCYIKKCLKGNRRVDTRVLFLTSAGCSWETVQKIRNEVEKYVRFEHVELVKASGTITCNCGPGAFGLLFIEREPASGGT